LVEPVPAIDQALSVLCSQNQNLRIGPDIDVGKFDWFFGVVNIFVSNEFSRGAGLAIFRKVYTCVAHRVTGFALLVE
jgi:hypothetical protein